MHLRLALGIALCTTGCYTVGDHVLAQASDELHCPSEELEVEQESGVIWRARGCGQDARFHCRRLPGLGLNCSQSSNPVGFVQDFIPSRRAEATSGGAEPVVYVQAPDATVEPESAEPAEIEERAPAPAVAPELDQHVRAALTERRELVRACTEQEVVVVRVDWDATGAVSVTLTGALAGGVEERCVQEAMSGFALDDPGDGGAVLHPVR